MKFLDEKMKKILIILGIVIVVLIVGALLINAFKGSSLSYEDIENKLLSSARDYYSDHKDMLPLTDDDVVEVSDSFLSENNYMKKLSEYQKNDKVSCSGKVVVTKSGKYYNYSPYLNCGDEFTTKYLYEKLLEDITDKDDGLYKINQYTSKNKTENVYVYRGDYVNNYVLLGGKKWQVVKMDSNYNMLLVEDYPGYDNSIRSVWDDRYNSSTDSNDGINDYYKSIVRTSLSSYYDSNLTDEVKSKIVVKDLCIGLRKDTDSGKDGKIECSKVLSGEYIGMLTVYDYMSASLDNNCKKTVDKNCGNYNYLSDYGRPYWLLNGSGDKTSKGYKADNSVYSTSLSYDTTVRPSIYINSYSVLVSGTGSDSDPYVVK